MSEAERSLPSDVTGATPEQQNTGEEAKLVPREGSIAAVISRRTDTLKAALKGEAVSPILEIETPDDDRDARRDAALHRRRVKAATSTAQARRALSSPVGIPKGKK
jgi:hypothetical protein